VFPSILAFLSALRVFFRSRSDIALEILALRQQVAVLKRKRPRPNLNRLDRLFWASLRRCWPRWAEVLVIVKPETVIGWHRAGPALLALALPATQRTTEGHGGDS
jgi:putative transposase